MEAAVLEYMMEKMLGHSGCIYNFRARDENYSLHKAVVNHDHQ